MTESHAAGRKTDHRTDPFEQELIAGIAVGREALAECFNYGHRLGGYAGDLPKGWDWIDATRARDTAINGGVAILKAIAEVTLAAAKLRGEFNHRYQVTRHIEQARAVDAVLLPEGEGVAES
jgi:hypothetical protein